MYNLKNKQLIHLTKGKYHDGGGLYIRITRQGKGLWTYRYNLNKTSYEWNNEEVVSAVIRLFYEIISSVLLSTITGFS